MKRNFVEFFRHDFLNFFSMDENVYEDYFLTELKINEKYTIKINVRIELKIHITRFQAMLILFI